jgi:hypothetical protein
MTPDPAATSLPGTSLLAFARLWFSPAIVASVFEPLVADWQRQWNDARPARRRWINVKGVAAFAATAAMMTPRLALEPGSFQARPLVVAGSFWLANAVILMLPFIREDVPLWSLWLLLPANLTLMLPFAVIPAIDALRRDGEEPTAADRRRAFILVVVAVCGVAGGQGWLTPVANQRWREVVWSEMNGRPMTPARGTREVTTGELLAGDVIIPALSGTPRVREITNRLTLALLPAVLAWLRWRSLGRVRKRSWPVLKSWLLALGATAAFFAVVPTGLALERIFVAPGFGPLLALALFAATTRAGIWLRQRAA